MVYPEIRSQKSQNLWALIPKSQDPISLETQEPRRFVRRTQEIYPRWFILRQSPRNLRIFWALRIHHLGGLSKMVCPFLHELYRDHIYLGFSWNLRILGTLKPKRFILGDFSQKFRRVILGALSQDSILGTLKLFGPWSLTIQGNDISPSILLYVKPLTD